MGVGERVRVCGWGRELVCVGGRGCERGLDLESESVCVGERV